MKSSNTLQAHQMNDSNTLPFVPQRWGFIEPIKHSDYIAYKRTDGYVALTDKSRPWTVTEIKSDGLFELSEDYPELRMDSDWLGYCEENKVQPITPASSIFTLSMKIEQSDDKLKETLDVFSGMIQTPLHEKRKWDGKPQTAMIRQNQALHGSPTAAFTTFPEGFVICLQDVVNAECTFNFIHNSKLYQKRYSTVLEDNQTVMWLSRLMVLETYEHVYSN